MPTAHPGDEDALFSTIAGAYFFRCPGCGACVSTEVDSPCSPFCRSLAIKTARRRRGGTEGGDRRG